MKSTNKWFGTYSRGLCAITLATVIGLSMAACDHNGTNGEPVTGISLNQPSLTLSVGGTEALIAAVQPENAANKDIDWTSVNPDVAIVDSNGTVSALSPGLTIIMATADGGKTATCAVSVTEELAAGAIPVTGVTLSPSTLLLGTGGKGKLIATVQPADATNKTVNWVSSNPGVAEVDNGTVTAKTVGTATIYVSTAEGGHSASCVVTVSAETAVPSDPSALSVNRYVAIPYTGGNIPARAVALNDSIKYSYSYDGYWFYYIYLGVLRNIPLFSFAPRQLSSLNTEYSVTVTESITNSVAEFVSESSQTAIGVVDEHTYSTTNRQKVSAEVKAGYKRFGFSAEAKASTEATWEQYTKDINTTSFHETTSLVNTVSRGTDYTKSTIEGIKWNWTKDDKVGYYRYTLFSASDVYLFVIKDPATGAIDYEFREHIKSDSLRPDSWGLDYSEDGYFGKTDDSCFEFDVALLKNLTKPSLVLTPDPPEEVPQTGPSFAEQLATLKAEAVNGGTYNLTLYKDESIGPQLLSYNGANVTITVEGVGGERTLSLSAKGYLLEIGSSVTLILDNNIRLRGRSDNNKGLVRVNSGGRLVMNTGSAIYGNSSTDPNGAVTVEKGATFTMNGGTISHNTGNGGGGGVAVGGTFTMNGGAISDNKVVTWDGGGVTVWGGGTFTMTGGTISNNVANESGGGVAVVDATSTFTMNGGTISGNEARYGGGVAVWRGGTFTMTGGTISNNVANDVHGNGGGVSVWAVYPYVTTFTKTGGTIYGYTAGDPNSNVVQNAAGGILNGKGHAVMASLMSSLKRKETTAGPTVNLSATATTIGGISIPQYSGAWD